MPLPMIIGNDIVDIGSPDAINKVSDERFITRVFTPQEELAIRKSPDAAIALWAMWAAKETAFKIIAKETVDPVFSHREFSVQFNDFPQLQPKADQPLAGAAGLPPHLPLDGGGGERVTNIPLTLTLSHKGRGDACDTPRLAAGEHSLNP